MKFPVIKILFVALPGVPHTPAGPPLTALPYCAVMPAPPGKLVIVLPEIVALVMFETTPLLPKPRRRMAEPCDVPLDVELVNVLAWMRAFVIVPLKFWMSMPCSHAFVGVNPVIVTVPLTLLFVGFTPVAKPKPMLESSSVFAGKLVPELSILQLVIVTFVTCAP